MVHVVIRRRAWTWIYGDFTHGFGSWWILHTRLVTSDSEAVHAGARMSLPSWFSGFQGLCRRHRYGIRGRQLPERTSFAEFPGLIRRNQGYLRHSRTPYSRIQCLSFLICCLNCVLSLISKPYSFLQFPYTLEKYMENLSLTFMHATKRMPFTNSN